MKRTVEDFLNRHYLNPDMVDIDEVCGLFLKEMDAGLAGKESSLAMIPSYCSPDARPKEGESVIVIDAGGTNFRTCIVTFDSDLKPVISNFRKIRMPGTGQEVSAKEFFSIIADELERLIDKSDKIGFCFSYAAEILPDHDGIPQMFSKEIKAKEVLGKHLGVEILAELASRGHDVSAKKVIVMNDTVTTLLAAQAKNSNGSYDGCVGFILGTGTNNAYIEKTSNITKIDPAILASGQVPENQIINVESGCLKLHMGDIDRKFLESTRDPDLYLFEKMVSGAYLGPLAFMVIDQAVKEGILSQEFADAHAAYTSLSTMDLNAFLKEEESNQLARCCKYCSEEDYDTLMEILGSFISRAAKLAAANLAAAVLKTDFGKDEDHPVLINADGTTFLYTACLKSYTTEYLDAYLAEKGRRAVITQIDDSPIIGSAIGALSL